MDKYKVVLVDDEPLMCEELASFLAEFEEVEVVGICYTDIEALACIGQQAPDIVFLDIQMPGQGGMQLAQKLTKFAKPPVIIFATAYDSFALAAFEVNAVDYLLKPFNESDLERALTKAKRFLAGRIAKLSPAKGDDGNEVYPQKFSAERNGKLDIIDRDEIQMVYAQDRLVYIQTTGGRTYTSKFTLHEFELKLDTTKFLRCHRNYIVNVDCIEQLAPWFNRGYLLTLQGTKKEQVPVSRNFVKELRRFIQF
ncbi:MAG: LytTR family DNA-binding domain-containing protein [Veillonellales bacterium]